MQLKHHKAPMLCSACSVSQDCIGFVCDSCVITAVHTVVSFVFLADVSHTCSQHHVAVDANIQGCWSICCIVRAPTCTQHLFWYKWADHMMSVVIRATFSTNMNLETAICVFVVGLVLTLLEREKNRKQTNRLKSSSYFIRNLKIGSHLQLCDKYRVLMLL